MMVGSALDLVLWPLQPRPDSKKLLRSSPVSDLLPVIVASVVATLEQN